MDGTDDGDLSRLQSLLSRNRSAQSLVRRHLRLVDDRLRLLDRRRITDGTDRAPPLTPAAVFARDPLQDDHGCRPPKSAQDQGLQLIESVIPLRHEPGVWSAEKRVALRNGVIHQNRVLLTRSVLREGATLPPGPDRNAIVKAKLDAIRNMSPEQLLLNTNQIDWAGTDTPDRPADPATDPAPPSRFLPFRVSFFVFGRGIALTHVRGKSATDCQIQWMCSDDPRINRRTDWAESEDDALMGLHAHTLHGFEWVKTASELGTRRTAVQCFQRYKALMAQERGDAAWTDDQDRQLGQLVGRYGAAYWSQVALYFPNRTRAQCSARYANSVQAWIRAGKWTTDESRRLKLAVDAYGPRWSRIALHVPGRTQTKCRERYMNEYETAVTAKRQRFTADEDAALLQAVADCGQGNWARIAARLQGRSDSQYRRRYARIMANRAKEDDAAAAQEQERPPRTPPAQADGGGSRRKRARRTGRRAAA